MAVTCNTIPSPCIVKFKTQPTALLHVTPQQSSQCLSFSRWLVVGLFIGQASVKMAGYWPMQVLFCTFLPSSTVLDVIIFPGRGVINSNERHFLEHRIRTLHQNDHAPSKTEKTLLRSVTGWPTKIAVWILQKMKPTNTKLGAKRPEILFLQVGGFKMARAIENHSRWKRAGTKRLQHLQWVPLYKPSAIFFWFLLAVILAMFF